MVTWGRINICIHIMVVKFVADFDLIGRREELR
ncbi:hypothetical protein ES703_23987 [subsurface metagenome]